MVKIKFLRSERASSDLISIIVLSIAVVSLILTYSYSGYFIRGPVTIIEDENLSQEQSTNNTSSSESSSLNVSEPVFIESTSSTKVLGNSGFSPLDVDVSSCIDLNTPNEVYILKNNIVGNQSDSKCIEILANNVTLDCAGYSITGNIPGSTYGVYVYNANNTKIKNCNISNYSEGIFISANGGENATIFNNTIYEISSKAIYLVDTNNVNITNNTIYNFYSGKGIYLDHILNGSIENNNLSNGYDAVLHVHSNYINYTNNTFNSITGTCLDAEGSFGYVQFLNVLNNNFSNCSTGIYLDYVNNSLIKDNEFSNSSIGLSIMRLLFSNITNNNILTIGLGEGITTGESSSLIDINILNNTVRGGNVGIRADHAINSTVANNVVNDTFSAGFVVTSGTSNSYFNNNIINNVTSGNAFLISSTFNSTFVNNILSYGGRSGFNLGSYTEGNNFTGNIIHGFLNAGVITLYTHNNNFYDNILYDNYEGIDLSSSDNNTFLNNSIYNSSYLGIYIDGVSNSVFVDNKVNNSNVWDLQTNNDINSTLLNMTFGNTKVDINHEGRILLKDVGVENSPPDPVGYTNISHYLNLSNGGVGWIFLNISYKNEEVPTKILKRENIRIWKFSDGKWWNESFVGDPSQAGIVDLGDGGYVYANVTNFSSIYAPLGETLIKECVDINYPGVYTLYQNLTGNQSDGICIEIKANDVTFDCNGFALNGNVDINSGYTIGISLSNSVVRATIKNCTIYNYWKGINLPYENNNSIIQDSTVDTTIYSIDIDSGENFTIFNNVVNNTTLYPIILVNSANVNLTNNIFERGNKLYHSDVVYVNYTNNSFNSLDSALSFSSASNIIIEKNNFASSIGGNSIYLVSGLFEDSTNIQIISNNISNQGEGISLSPGDYAFGNFSIKNNLFNNNTKAMNLVGLSNSFIYNNTINYGRDTNIYLRGSNNTLINDTILNTNQQAIFLSYADQNLISNNTLINISKGILVSNSDYNNLTYNNIFNSSNEGIKITASKFNFISDNYLYNNSYGIYLMNTNNTSIKNNDLNLNSQAGIYLSTSYSNKINDTNIITNLLYGIYLNKSNNNFFKNIKIDNTSAEEIYMSPLASSNNLFSNISLNKTTINFSHGGSIAIKHLNPNEYPLDPSGRMNISHELRITNITFSPWIFLTIFYNDSDISPYIYDESTILIWKYSESDGNWYDAYTIGNQWQMGVDTEANYVYANISNFSSIFAPLGVMCIDNDGDGFGVGDTSGCLYAFYVDCDDNNNEIHPLVNNTVIPISHNLTVCTGTYENAGVGMTSPNIFLDCNNSILNCSRESGCDGIGVDSQDFVTIKNCNIIGSYVYGISLYATNNSTVVNNTIYNSTESGIYTYASSNNIFNSNIIGSAYKGFQIDEGSNNTLINNTIEYTSNMSIYLNLTSDNKIVNNDIKNSSDYGIFLEGSSNNNITNNKVILNSKGINLMSYSDYNYIFNNNVSDSTYEGINLQLSSHNLLLNNTANYNQYGLVSYYPLANINNTIINNALNNNQYGLYFEGIQHNITNNIIKNNSVIGAQLNQVNDTIFSRNIVVENTDRNLYLYSIVNSNITDNNCSQSTYGISGFNVYNSNFINNTCNSNFGNNLGEGLYLSSSENVSVINNTLNDNKRYGIDIYYSNNIAIINNTAKNNSYEGCMIIYSNNDIISNNKFINNNINLYISQDNQINITNNYFDFGVYYNLFISPANDINILNNIFNISQTGMYIDSVGNINITNNSFYGNGNNGIVGFNVENLTFDRNSLSNVSRGVQTNNFSNSNFVNNNFFNVIYGGLNLYLSQNNTIKNNSFINLVGGTNCLICLGSSNYNNVSENKIFNSSNYGISLSNSSNNLVSDNLIYNNSYGLHLTSLSNENILTNLTINYSSLRGINLESSSNNNFTNILMFNNTWDFISDENSLNNRIINLTLNDTNCNFIYEGIIHLVDSDGTNKPDLPGYSNLSHYVKIEGSPTSWIFLNLSYKDSDISPKIYDNNTIRIWKFSNEKWWNESFVGDITQAGINTFNKYIYANITNFSSIYAPMGSTNHAPTISNIIFTNYTTGHSFNATVNVTDLDGYEDLSYFTINSTECVLLSSVMYNSTTNITTFKCTNTTSVKVLPIEITIYDSVGAYASVTGSNGYPNNAPSKPVVTIIPSIAYNNDNLNCTVSGSTDLDPEDTIYYYFNWSNGTHEVLSGRIAQTSFNLSAGNTSKGQTWTCTVTPTDTFVNGTSNSTNVTILNSIPTLEGISISTNPIKGGSTQTISAVNPNDNDQDELNFYCCNDTSNSCIPSLSNNICDYIGKFSYPYSNMNCSYIVPNLGYQEIYVRCRTYDDSAYSNIVNNSFVEDDIAPSIEFIEPPTPLDGSKHLGTSVEIKVTVSNNLPIDQCIIEFDGFNYTMVKYGSGNVVNCTYVNNSLIRGKTYTYKVYANDSVDNVAISGLRNFYVNTLPLISTPVITSSLPTTINDLTCNATLIDNEESTLKANWTWFRNGISMLTGQTENIPNNTNSIITTLSNIYTTKGENWSCSVIPYDNYEYGIMKNSSNVTILNSAPIIGQPTINNETPLTNDIITCINGTFEDNDSDTAIWYYKWYENGFLISGQTSNTLDLSLSGLDKGDNITCSVLANDGEVNASDGWQNSSNYAIIQNSIPTTPTSLILNSPKVGENLTAICSGSSDADGDTITYYYQFYNTNDSFIVQDWSTLNNYSVNISDANDVIEVTCKAYDSTSYSNNITNVTTISSADLNVTIFVNGVETNIFENAGEPYNLTVIVKDKANEVPIQNAQIKVTEINGYTPFTQPQYNVANVSNYVYGLINTSSSGVAMMTAIPTGGRYVDKSKVGSYNITVNVSKEGYNDFVKEMTVTYTDFKTPINSINIPNRNNIESFNLEVYRIYAIAKGWLLLGGGVNYTVKVFTNGTIIGLPNQFISGKPTALNVSVINHTNFEPVINATIMVEERNGYPPFILPQYMTTNVSNFAVGLVKTGIDGTAKFTIIPTGGRYIQSNSIGPYRVTIYIYNNDSLLINSTNIDVDDSLPAPSGQAYGIFNKDNIESFNLELYRIYALTKGWLIY